MNSERSWLGDLAWYEARGLRELVRVVEDKGDRVAVVRGYAGCLILDDRNELSKSELANIGDAWAWAELYKCSAGESEK